MPKFLIKYFATTHEQVMEATIWLQNTVLINVKMNYFIKNVNRDI